VNEYAFAPPHATVLPPAGEIEPLASDVAEIVYGPSPRNVTLIVWLACTFVNV
jgi:hypothetical protein